ncbi:MAG: hypothetical protein MUD17_07820 [Gemmatimonadaceae bacterium]|jgi:hypothetical protein|nr:hypothetical protein [Gemmatimonadaceae bacterium]
MMRRLRAVALCVTIACGLAACDHPIGIVSAHIEAADLVVRDSAGVELTRTSFNRRWMVDSLVLRDGASLRVTITPVDFRGVELDVSERRDVSYRFDAERAELVQWEPQRGFGWLHPFGRGETRVRFLIWHGDHADFVSPWLRVVIR